MLRVIECWKGGAFSLVYANQGGDIVTGILHLISWISIVGTKITENYLCIVMSEQNLWDVSTRDRPLASDPISDFSGHENVQLVKCKHCMLSRQRNF